MVRGKDFEMESEERQVGWNMNVWKQIISLPVVSHRERWLQKNEESNTTSLALKMERGHKTRNAR